MSERRHDAKHEQSTSPEHHKQHHEHAKRLEADRASKAAEHSPGAKQAETTQARHEAHQLAQTAEQVSLSSERPAQDEFRTRETKAHAFDTTMHHVRTRLSRSERSFSKFIHKPGVETTSEFIGKTVTRPSGIIGATLFVCIGLLLIYSVARFAGFSLSGSELPLLLLVGFIVGLLVEWLFKVARSLFSRSND